MVGGCLLTHHGYTTVIYVEFEMELFRGPYILKKFSCEESRVYAKSLLATVNRIKLSEWGQKRLHL